MMGFKLAACLSLLASTAVHARYLVTPLSELRDQDKLPSSVNDVDPKVLYPAYNISIPVDHFQDSSMYEPHDDGMFDVRYWFDASNYKKGGPVIILHGGETDGENRLPFIQKGMLAQLAQATHGISVILEHRYYGKSFPTEDLSTKNLRFLTTEQALADSAYFAKNVEFEGLEDEDLTAPNTPYILYGGSYAGGQVAFLRVEYPDLFWGAIASSGVTKAIYDFWEYFEPIRKHAPQECVKTTQAFVDIVDNILIHKDDSELTTELKELFNLGGLTENVDFANFLAGGIVGWQGTNWDPAITDPSFYEYCDNITTSEPLYPTTPEVEKSVEHVIKEGGHGRDMKSLLPKFLNYIGYLTEDQVAPCLARDMTADECFGTKDVEFHQQDDITQTWRSWAYQYCTEWGYLQTGSGNPENIDPVISRLIDLPYMSQTCRDAFGREDPPDVDRVNKYGGFDIEYSRLAFIDGEADPWVGATPHSEHAKPRKDSIDKPFVMIDDAVHHWDENGLFPNETTAELPPKRVKDVQKYEIKFVKEWLKDWKREHKD